MCISVPLNLQKRNITKSMKNSLSLLNSNAVKQQLKLKQSISGYVCTNCLVTGSIWNTEDNLMQIVAMINNNFKNSKSHISKGAPPIVEL